MSWATAAVVIAFAFAAAAQAFVFAALIRSRDRQHARERDLLLNQLLHACGTPWQPAPANTETAGEPAATGFEDFLRPAQHPA